MSRPRIIFASIIFVAIVGAALLVSGAPLFERLNTLAIIGSLKEPPPPPFDPAGLIWSLATSSAQWRTRDSAASFVFQNKLWTIGGLDGNGHRDAQGVEHYWEAPHFNDIWSTVDGREWTQESAHAEFPPRRSMSIVEFNGTLFMIGGHSPTNGVQGDVWQSDDGITWRKVVDKAAFVPREGQTVEVFAGRLFMMGGVNYQQQKVLNDVWYSDNGTDWVLATSSAPWRGRWDHDTEVFNGRMYLVGGMDLSLRSFNDVWVTEDGFTWTQVTEHAPWQERQGLQLVSFKEHLWILGRLNDAADNFGPNDVWYSADGVTWQKTLIDPPWMGREDHSALVYNGRMHLFGGMDAEGQWRNDVWVSSE